MIRIGIGYDIHRTISDRALYLCGVEIPSDFGLDGHSDADVGLHALMDAMLGAAGLPDIGVHFPPGDERYRAISSLALLEEVRTLIDGRGYRVSNADIVVVAERPRLAPHVSRMLKAMSAALRIDEDCLSVKATTNEGVGPEGRGEAISAQAVCLIQRVV